MSGFLQQLNDDLGSLVSGVRPWLAQVASGRRGAGAGIVWGSQGLIVTNAHVVRRHTPQVILADGRAFPARVLGADLDNDLAALAIEAGDLPAAQIGDSRRLRPGQVVLAMGHPWGITGAATAGVVVASGRDLIGMPGSDRDLIAVSLHLRPGYSGGLLADDAGRVIGVNVMMAGPEVGLAIPAHTVETFLAALKEQIGAGMPQPGWMPTPAADV